jgi:hypothetical protein
MKRRRFVTLNEMASLAKGTDAERNSYPGTSQRSAAARREISYRFRTIATWARKSLTKVASPNIESSNQLFETLEEWNDYLER